MKKLISIRHGMLLKNTVALFLTNSSDLLIYYAYSAEIEAKREENYESFSE